MLKMVLMVILAEAFVKPVAVHLTQEALLRQKISFAQVPQYFFVAFVGCAFVFNWVIWEYLP